MKNVRIIEITNDNYNKYLSQVADLEEKVFDKMQSEGQEGQFFTTGYDDILDYALSKNNTVLVAVDNDDKVLAATYLTEGQISHTYNDITKYFKTGEEYTNWVKNQYSSDDLYKKDILNAYKLKIEAYVYARGLLLSEYPMYNTIPEFLKHELNEENNRIS